MTLMVGVPEAVATATNDNARMGMIKKTGRILEFVMLRSTDFQRMTS